MPLLKYFLFYISVIPALSAISQPWAPGANLDTTLESRSLKIKYIDNLDNGDRMFFMYDKTDRLESTLLITKKNDFPYGQITEYYPNGNISRQFSFYVAGKKLVDKKYLDSTYVEYFENGNKKSEWLF